MTDELRNLYRDLILDHSRRPRNHRAIGAGARHAEGYNPLCGDRLTVYLTLADNVLKEVAFEGVGCALAIAAASMMTEAVTGRSPDDADACFRDFRALLTGESLSAAGAATLGDLAAFAGVRGFPARVKCATLAWQTLLAALAAPPETASHK